MESVHIAIHCENFSYHGKAALKRTDETIERESSHTHTRTFTRFVRTRAHWATLRAGKDPGGTVGTRWQGERKNISEPGD
ncbi:hypothetical protein CEXT_770501 [Caerostris extrusa]|uniref:Uncharacterized protein n=1 Tax=Caerostris extrusa TaxID=172846 RepID=A0AAV4N235_CAEEX|nr:hypothetical protein CEXT_770501 [Caerostris extrusa]